jgi:6-phosphogluconolactonase (cycloisomerase 2 family)
MADGTNEADQATYRALMAAGVQFSSDSRFMYVAELGLDRVYSYRVDPESFSIAPADPAFVSTHAGAGPLAVWVGRSVPDFESVDGRRMGNLLETGICPEW